MTPERFRSRVLSRLGSLPGGLAVLGKWEPFLPAHRCLEEVRARAAAALAISEALEPRGPGPFLLNVEARLRGQPRPGCQLAAEILVELGARPARIRLSPAANRTSLEVHALERLRRVLGLGSLLCITAGYHVDRARRLLERERLSPRALQVLSSEDELVHEALTALAPSRRHELLGALVRGRRASSPLTLASLGERLARLGARLPALEKLLADCVRGAPPEGEAPILTCDLRLPVGSRQRNN